MDEKTLDLIKVRMKEFGIDTEADMVRRSGIKQATLWRLLNKPNYNPTLKTLEKLLDTIEIPCLSIYQHKIDIEIISQLKDLDEDRKNIVLTTITGLKKL